MLWLPNVCPATAAPSSPGEGREKLTPKLNLANTTSAVPALVPHPCLCALEGRASLRVTHGEPPALSGHLGALPQRAEVLAPAEDTESLPSPHVLHGSAQILGAAQLVQLQSCTELPVTALLAAKPFSLASTLCLSKHEAVISVRGDSISAR